MDKKQRYSKITEPMPGFYEITSSFVQMHLLVGQHHALLVDTGYGFIDLPGIVRNITELPLYIVNPMGTLTMHVAIHPSISRFISTQRIFRYSKHIIRSSAGESCMIL